MPWPSHGSTASPTTLFRGGCHEGASAVRRPDLDLEPAERRNADDLIADLGFDTLLDAMAGGDGLIRAVARAVLLDR